MDGSGKYRGADRFSLKLPTRIEPIQEGGSKETLELVTSDICAFVSFLQTDTPLPVGTKVKIEIILPLENRKNIEGTKAFNKVSGAVIWTPDAVCFENHYVIATRPVKKTGL